MFGTMQSGAQSYAKVGMETGVTSASPHKLIVMLFDGALVAITSALQHMKAGDIPAKGKAISHAITIIDGGLRMSLDKARGGEIAQNLDALYGYMSDRLLLANAQNKPELLEEVYRLLKDLKGAWDAIGESPGGKAPEAPKAVAYDPLAPQPRKLVRA